MQNIKDNTQRIPFKTKIKNFYIENKVEIHKCIISLILILIIVLVFYTFSKLFTLNLFRELFQDFVKGPDMLLYLYTGIYLDSLIISELAIYFTFKKFISHKKTEKIWFCITVITIILFLILGFFFLVGFTSHDLSSYLRDSKNNTIVGQLNCTDNSGNLFLVNKKIVCYIQSPILYNFSAKINFIFINGSSYIISQNNNISFDSPLGMRRIDFNILGLDKNNNTVSLSTGRDFEFYTPDQYSERKSQFYLYLFYIIGAVLITIPSITANWKTLFEK
jgi:hypothetical protein